MSVNWRAVITEIWGTWFLTFVAAVSLGNPFVVSTTLFCTIVGTGNISGAHWNPAVTTAFILVDVGNKVKGNLVTHLLYIPMQFIGAISASFMAWGVSGETLELKIHEDSTYGQAIFVEILGTWILAYVIITCGEHNAIRLSPPLACSSALFLILKTIAWVSGGGYNPAIGFALDLADAAHHGWDRLEDDWIYWWPSMLGGVLAAGFYFVMIPAFRARLNKLPVKHEKQETIPTTEKQFETEMKAIEITQSAF